MITKRFLTVFFISNVVYTILMENVFELEPTFKLGFRNFLKVSSTDLSIIRLKYDNNGQSQKFRSFLKS